MSIPRLQDFTCPGCSSQKQFYVDVLATVHLDSCGASLVGDYFADGDFNCVCLDCQHEGKVFGFTAATRKAVHS
jgi:ribosomal protein S27E